MKPKVIKVKRLSKRAFEALSALGITVIFASCAHPSDVNVSYPPAQPNPVRVVIPDIVKCSSEDLQRNDRCCLILKEEPVQIEELHCPEKKKKTKDKQD